MASAQRPTRRRKREIVSEAPRHPEAALVISEELAAALLDRANAKILQSTGFDSSTRVAHERLRGLAENYILSMTRQIAQFMLIQRRTRPTVTDFQQMLINSNISVTDLENEKRRVPSTTPVALPPPPEVPEEQKIFFDESQDVLRELLGDELDGATDRREYIPDYLPPFPSRHTYIATPVFADRPKEAREIRERASEEARLAENALRKLLAAAAAGAEEAGRKKSMGELATSGPDGVNREGQGSGGRKEGNMGATSRQNMGRPKKRKSAWEKAFEAAAAPTKENVATASEHGSTLYSSGHVGHVDKGKDTVGRTVGADIWVGSHVNADTNHWRVKKTGRA